MKIDKFGLDIFILPLLIVAHMHFSDVQTYLLVLPLLAYLLLDVAYPLVDHPNLANRRTRYMFLLRWALVWIMIVGSVMLPIVTNIQTHLAAIASNPSGYTDTYALGHDGAFQMESALNYLDAGKNPYVETYEDTPVSLFFLAGEFNPAIDYFVYLPGFIVVSMPFYQLFDLVGLTYDQRWVYLIAYIVLALLLPQLVDAPTSKLTLLTAVALNPLLTRPVIKGMNDVVIILTIFIVIFFLQKRKLLWSALFFGFACTLKQSAWFMASFYLLYVMYSPAPEDRKRLFFSIVGIMAVVGIVVIGPFALWSFPDFITDAILYPSGSVPNNFPIRGYTIGVFLVGLGFIPSILDYFPFWTLQLIFGIPLLLLLLSKQVKQNHLGTMLFYSGIFIFGMGFVSRFFQSNYVGFVTILLSAGVLLTMFRSEQTVTPDNAIL